MSTAKYYVVWRGRRTGLFSSWSECERQVRGFAGAQYKAFSTRAEAAAALREPYARFRGKPASHGRWRNASVQPILPSICVDAACAGARGPMEYRGVQTADGEEVFHAGPFRGGTNNIGEFLAIAHALTWLEKHSLRVPIYTDSENAITWIFTGECRTKLRHTTQTAPVFALIHSAENWLAENELPENLILKWDTALWGEIPADFGRK